MSRIDQAATSDRPPDSEVVESLFDSALQRSPEQRAAFLAEACRGDAALHSRVARLLECFECGAAALEAPPPSLLEDDLLASPETSPGQRVGPYELLRNLASGGMGTVWLARRADDQYEKQVAIKLIKRGMDTEALLARFRMERQVLAGLEHPNIARLLDGGVTQDGLPYLVMEFVDGLPIDRYCIEHELTVTQRLHLFRAVCAAVQFAHQSLIVHRDLKPGNILVVNDTTGSPASYNPRPVLLDFGIAKVLHPDSAEVVTAETSPDLRIMTPRYASPEQVRGGKITTASDVYSLGVVLYELLTGHEPYELATGSRPEYERAICEQEPRSRLVGDLDMIVLKALRKEPERRYHTVEQFSEDIRRHLENLPITARPDSWRYRARKLVARNARLVSAAALIALSLIAGTIVSASLYLKSESNRRRAEEESRRAAIALQAEAAQVKRANELERAARDETQKGRSANAFLNEMLEQWLAVCRGADPLTRLRERLDVTVREMDSGKRSYHPEVEAIVQLTIGDTYRSIGRPAEAESHYLRSLELRRTLFGERDSRVAEPMERLGKLYRATSRLADAARMIEGALEIRKSTLPPSDGYFAVNYNSLGMLRRAQRKHEEALHAYQESLRVYRLFAGPEAESVHVVLANIGSVYLEMGRYVEAENTLRQSFDLARRTHGELHEHVAQTEALLGMALHMQGDLDGQAELLLRDAVITLTSLLGPHDFEVAEARARLAACLSDVGRLAEAESIVREAITNMRPARRGDQTASALTLLGNILHRENQFDQAETTYLDAIAQATQDRSTDNPVVATAMEGLGEVYVAMGCFPNAEPLLLKAEATLAYASGSFSRSRDAARRTLVELNEAWHAADPSGNHLAQATRWRALAAGH